MSISIVFANHQEYFKIIVIHQTSEMVTRTKFCCIIQTPKLILMVKAKLNHDEDLPHYIIQSNISCSFFVLSKLVYIINIENAVSRQRQWVRHACGMQYSYDSLTGKPGVWYQYAVSIHNDNEQILNDLCQTGRTYNNHEIHAFISWESKNITLTIAG